jgi:hypothetical protein
MVPHDHLGPPKKPNPRDAQAKRLLFVIAVLLGLIAAQIAKRLI